jgi:hypothetical protein
VWVVRNITLFNPLSMDIGSEREPSKLKRAFMSRWSCLNMFTKSGGQPSLPYQKLLLYLRRPGKELRDVRYISLGVDGQRRSCPSYHDQI